MTVDAVSSPSIPARVVDTVASAALLCVETAAQLSLGQAILRMVDRFLWIIEKSAQWSLPCQEETAEENGKSFGKLELVRPLPWIFFLPTLIILRTLRFGLNVGAFVLGWPRIEPSAVVKFLQKSRRRLRAIKVNGMKYMRQRKDVEGTEGRESAVNDIKWKSAELIRSIQLTLFSLSCLDGPKSSPSPPPMRIKVRMNHESARLQTPTPEEKSTTESAPSPMHTESKRKYSEVSSDERGSEGSEDENETVEAKLDRLAALSGSLDDEDFNPGDLSTDGGSSSSSSGDSSISATELQCIQDEANLILHRAFAGVAEVIAEEPEPTKRGEAEQRTGGSETFESPSTDCAPENSEEHREYHSPCKFGDDGDTAFYSPISSNNSSPERTVPVNEQGLQVSSGGNDLYAGDGCRNGEVDTDLKKPTSDTPAEKRSNGHAEEKGNASTNVSAKTANKPHHRARRAGHASRKKK